MAPKPSAGTGARPAGRRLLWEGWHQQRPCLWLSPRLLCGESGQGPVVCRLWVARQGHQGAARAAPASTAGSRGHRPLGGAVSRPSPALSLPEARTRGRSSLRAGRLRKSASSQACQRHGCSWGCRALLPLPLGRAGRPPQRYSQTPPVRRHSSSA